MLWQSLLRRPDEQVPVSGVVKVRVEFYKSRILSAQARLIEQLVATCDVDVKLRTEVLNHLEPVQFTPHLLASLVGVKLDSLLTGVVGVQQVYQSVCSFRGLTVGDYFPQVTS